MGLTFSRFYHSNCPSSITGIVIGEHKFYVSRRQSQTLSQSWQEISCGLTFHLFWYLLNFSRKTARQLMTHSIDASKASRKRSEGPLLLSLRSNWRENECMKNRPQCCPTFDMRYVMWKRIKFSFISYNTQCYSQNISWWKMTLCKSWKFSFLTSGQFIWQPIETHCTSFKSLKYELSNDV